jgi:hypothetical protein
VKEQTKKREQKWSVGATLPPFRGSLWLMCNLYSITTNQEAIIRLFRQVNRYVGNLARCRACF